MKTRALAVALIAFLGMIDTFYLAAKRGAGPIPCRLTGGCNDVLASKYSTVLGIPLSTIGLIFYLIVFSVAVFQIFNGGNLLKWVFWLALPGFLVSLCLVAIQAFVLHAYCEYCLGSAILETSILILSASALRAGPLLEAVNRPEPSSY